MTPHRPQRLLTTMALAATSVVAVACAATINGTPYAQGHGPPPPTTPVDGPTDDDDGGDPDPVTGDDPTPATDDPATGAAPGTDPAPDPGPTTDAGTPHGDHLVTPEMAQTTWDVELADDATIIDYDTVAAGLVDADIDTGTYSFSSAALAGTDLRPGQVVMVAGTGIGRITDINESGGTTTIDTERANLADAIDNGVLAWDAELGYQPQWGVPDDGTTGDGLWAGAGSAVDRPQQPRLIGIDLVDDTGTVIDATLTVDAGQMQWSYSAAGLKVEIAIQPAGADSSITVQISKSGLSLTATGTVSAVRSSGRAVYQGGKLTSADINPGEFQIDIDTSLAAAGSGILNGGGQIDLPTPNLMFKYLIPVGPVPVVLGVGAQLIAQIHVPAEGSAVFDSTFSYSSVSGFAYRGGDVTYSGDLVGLQLTPGAADPAAFIGQVVDLQFGIAYPRIQLDLFGIGLIGFIQTGMTLGTSLTWGPVCKDAYVTTSLMAGYDFSILGVSVSEGKVTLAEDRKDARGDSCE